MPQCGSVKCIASKEGYLNDTLEASLFDLANMSDFEKSLKLSPIKGSVKVIVKNLKTKSLLPDATVTLTINGASSTLQTNTNGVGVGLFDSLRISNTLSFKASKAGYADTTLDGGTVQKFMELPEEERTMYLRPLTTSLVFYNTDGSQPLAGVKNEIRINGKLKATEYSNAQGEFTVLGIGENGHLGFNQPGTPFGSTTWISRMDEKLDERIRRESGSAPDADLGGFTVGIKNIMMSRRIVLAANGSGKAEIIFKALRGSVCPEVPASVLQLHPFAETILDPEAAVLLKET